MKFLLLIIYLFFSLPLFAQKPDFESNDVQSLTNFLVKDAKNKSDKVRAIYEWITNNIRYDVEAYWARKPQNYTIKQILNKKKGVCQQYSDLFEAMCKIAKIKSVQVNGYVKDIEYEKDEHFFIAEHIWNAVEIENKWYFVDATWGSGTIILKKQIFKKFLSDHLKIPFWYVKPMFLKSPNNKYLFVEPQNMLQTHLPEQAMWQFSEKLKSMQDFEGKENLSVPKNNDYEKQIKHYFSVNKLEKTMFLAKKAQEFNPKNHFDLALAYLQYATKNKTDSTDFYLKTGLAHTIQYENEVHLFYKYKRLKIDFRYKKISEFNKNLSKKIKKQLKNIQKTEKKLEQKLSDQKELEISYVIDKIRKPLKKNIQKEDFIDEFIPEIEKNKKIIQEKIENEFFFWDRIKIMSKLEKDCFVKELELEAQNKDAIELNTELNIKKSEFEYIEKNQRTMILNNVKIIKLGQEKTLIRTEINKLFYEKEKLLNQLIRLCDHSKKMLEKIKKSSPTDQNEQQTYDQIHELQLNIKKIWTEYLADKNQNLTDWYFQNKNFIKNKKIILKKQQKALKNERRMAKSVFKHSIKRLNYKRKMYLLQGQKIRKYSFILPLK